LNEGIAFTPSAINRIRNFLNTRGGDAYRLALGFTEGWPFFTLASRIRNGPVNLCGVPLGEAKSMVLRSAYRSRISISADY
jgi:hypothetical protein